MGRGRRIIGVAAAALVSGVMGSGLAAVAGSLSASGAPLPHPPAAPPAPTITGHPANPTTQTIATFAFTDAEAGVSFECSLDGAREVACTSGVTYHALSFGRHVFSVEAATTGPGRHAESAPAVFAWTVVLAPPIITGHPANPTTQTTATFTYTDSQPGISDQCSLDSRPYVPCGSGGVTYTHLSTGHHTFKVEAVSGRGPRAVVSAPATFAWTIGPTHKPTTTTLTLSTTTATYGQEYLVIASGKVTGQPGSGVPLGTVTVSATTGTTLCTVVTFSVHLTADTVTFSCFLPAATLSSSTTPYRLTATFTSAPTSTYAGSTSTPPKNLTVHKATKTTTTTLTLSSPSVASGSETSVTFSGTVTGVTGDGNPQGTVTVKAGATTLCTSSLSVTGTHAGTFTCHTTATKLAASTTPYAVGATYTGGNSSDADYSYTGSTSTPSQALTVTTVTEATTTSLALSSGTATYGSETTEKFTMTVTGVSAKGYPTGPATVTTVTTTTTICTATLTHHTGDIATYTCSLTASQLAVGTYGTLEATYAGGPSSTPGVAYTGSSSTPATSLTVLRATPSFTVAINHDFIAYGSKATLSETGIPATATGTVTFKATTGPTLCTATLPTTSCTTSAALPVAFYPTIRGYFTSTSPNDNDSTSTNTVTLTVTPAIPSFTVGVNQSSIPYGSKDKLTDSGLPVGATGTVTFTTTTSGVLCTATLPTTSCTTSASLTARTYVVSGYFSSTSLNYTTATSTNTAPFSVTAVTPSFTVAINHTTITYGKTAQLSETGIPAGATGTVTFSTGTGTPLCTAFLPTTTCTTLSTLTTGTYSTIKGHYTPTRTNFTSATSSNHVTLSVTTPTQPTTTTLTLSTSSVTYGTETQVTFSGTVSGHATDGYPKGTVTVKATGIPLCTTGLVSGTATHASYSCKTTAAKLLATYYTVTATYTPTPTSSSSVPGISYESSTSTAHTLTVSPATPSFTVDASPGSIPYGTTATLSETGIPAGATGTVTFTANGTPLCTATLPATSCTTSATLAAQDYTVTGFFTPGTQNYATATSANSVELTVELPTAPTSVTLTLSTSSVTFGTESFVSISGTVTGQPTEGYPTGGSVTVEATTTTVICTVLVAGPGATTDTATFGCFITPGQLLSHGTYTFTATYSGGASSKTGVTYTTSTSGPQYLTVTKATKGTTMSLYVSPSTVTWGTETAVTFSGTVFGGTGDGYPVGTVTVTSTGTPLCSTAVDSVGTTSHYSCSITPATAKALDQGSHTITATYTPTSSTSSSTGNATYTGSTTTASLTVSTRTDFPTVTLTVFNATLTYGRETTETFTGSVTGTSGDGSPLGTVSVYSTATASTPLCVTFLLTGPTGTSTFHCKPTTPSAMGVGTHEVYATYVAGAGSSTNTNVSYQTSTSSTEGLKVLPAYVTTTTSLTITPTFTYFGTETAVTLSGTVEGVTPGTGAPVGTVTIETKTGTPLCIAVTLTPNGTTSTFTCQLSGTPLSQDFWTLRARYYPTYPGTSSTTPNYQFNASVSPTERLTVTGT